MDTPFDLGLNNAVVYGIAEVRTGDFEAAGLEIPGKGAHFLEFLLHLDGYGAFCLPNPETPTSIQVNTGDVRPSAKTVPLRVECRNSGGQKVAGKSEFPFQQRTVGNFYGDRISPVRELVVVSGTPIEGGFRSGGYEDGEVPGT